MPEAKTERIGFRVTPSELAAVEKGARHCGWTVSSFACQSTLHAARSKRKGKPKEQPRADVAELARLTRAVGHLAARLEELAREERRPLRLPEHVVPLTDEMQAIRRTLTELRRELTTNPKSSARQAAEP